MEKGIKLTKSNVSWGISIITVIVAVVLYVADRPSRSEVREMLAEQNRPILEWMKTMDERLNNILARL